MMSKTADEADEEGEGLVVWRTPLATGTFPAQRGGHSAVLYGHRMVVFGGHCHKGSGNFDYYNDCHVLNLESLRWKTTKCKGDVPLPRYGHTATVYGDSMYVFGGRGANGVVFRDVDRLDFTNWTWSKMSSTNMMPPGRFGHSATLVGNKIVIFGGFNGKNCYNDLWVYSIESTKWLKPNTHGRPPIPRHGHSCLLGEEGGLIVYGGYNVMAGKMPQYLSDTRELHLQDMEWRRLSPTGDFPLGRFGHTSAIHGTQMVVFGGYAGAQKKKALVKEKRDLRDKTPQVDEEAKALEEGGRLPYLFALHTENLEWWQPGSEGEPPDMRYGHSMTYVGAGHYLIFGGWDGTRPLNSLVDLHIPE